jgi:ribosomal protein S7
MESKHKVPVTLAQECIKSIRLLAQTGRGVFSHYLYEPLEYAGWKLEQKGQSARKLMERIDLEIKNPSFLHTIGPRCKRVIMNAMEEELSVLGDASIFFFNKMQLHSKISSSPESIEFAEILHEPLLEFHKKTSEQNEDLFKKAIANIHPSELKTAFEPVKIDSSVDKVMLDSEIKRLYDNILIASKYNNIPKCMKILSNYIIRYSDDEEYAKRDVDRLTEAMEKREQGFSHELRNMIAIELYYKITQGVMQGNINAAVQSIRKYGYIFEGDTDAKYFYDIDKLERILYQMITDKNMWEDLK